MTFVASLGPSGHAPRGRIWFAVGRRGLLVRRDDERDGARWILPRERELDPLGLPLAEAHYLGRLDDADAFAVEVPEAVDLPEGWTMLGIRSLAEAFDEETFTVAGRATHVIDWATTSRFCGRCGAKPVRAQAETERCMECRACGLTMFPRIAPAVIVLVRKRDLALLARNARFPLPFFSTLAGFSEIGETLEETLHREIFEEVGLRVRATRYFGSQPWPFPHSLMVGFTAEWESGEIAVDTKEIAEARWFSADDLPLIPPRLSIARRLIDAWIDEVRAHR